MKKCPACNSTRYKEVNGVLKCPRCGFMNPQKSEGILFVQKAKIKKCKVCGKEFEQPPNARFERKYCKECSEQRKKDYENLWEVRAKDCE